jgi:hypothetical protein
MCKSAECLGEVKQSAILVMMFDDAHESSFHLSPRDHRLELRKEFVCGEKYVYILSRGSNVRAKCRLEIVNWMSPSWTVEG